MVRANHNSGFSSALFIVLLLAAQFSAAVHAFEHDIGAAQGNLCQTCVTAAQLGTACMDSHAAMAIEPPRPSHNTVCFTGSRTTHVIAVRQRGPPAPL
jgi:hypothetical protein